VSATAVRVSPAWLVLREPADAAARSSALAGRLAQRVTGSAGVVVHDLGGGSGAMGRWLAPRLPVPQHWVVHDRDADLLQLALADPPPGVGVEARRSDVTRLSGADLAGADLVVASALLDLLTADELAAMLDAWAGRCPLLLALSVTGRVVLFPGEPLDARIAAAFNAHQRRHRLLGPHAVVAAVDALRRTGAEVLVRPSPWRLGAAERELTRAWLEGWVSAAAEQEPAPAAELGAYRERRLAQATAGRLAVTVDHADVLVLP
jgi:hypothetical protein